jgi:hypothetical protein
MMMPTTAPAAMSKGSGTLNRQLVPSTASAISTVGTSMMARRARTKQAPAMVPEAAAVTPATKALTFGFALMRSKYGYGITTKRYTGRNTPTAAATAPGKPATR